MEGFLFTDRVLQDSHMTGANKFPKYLKKYDIKNSKIRHTHLHPQNCSWTHTPSPKTEDHQRYLHHDAQRLSFPKHNKQKLNLISEDDSKSRSKPTNSTDFQQFFVKKCIYPKTSRQYTQRVHVLFKPPSVIGGKYYDVKMNFVKKKSRNCIILPEKNDKQNLSPAKEKIKEKKVKEWVEEEREQQRRKRNAKCKTAQQRYRQKNKTTLIKQVRKMEEQLRNKEFEEKSFRHQKNCLYSVSKENWKKTQPLSKQQMKQLCSSIMKKYGIDNSAYSQCVRKLL